jgi:hypothetical protein
LVASFLPLPALCAFKSACALSPDSAAFFEREFLIAALVCLSPSFRRAVALRIELPDAPPFKARQPCLAFGLIPRE